jgi:hypothetical protein
MYSVMYKTSDDGMITFTWLCVCSILYTQASYSHHHKLLLLERLNSGNPGHIVCLFICSSMTFLLPQLYWVGRQSTQLFSHW